MPSLEETLVQEPRFSRFSFLLHVEDKVSRGNPSLVLSGCTLEERSIKEEFI